MKCLPCLILLNNFQPDPSKGIILSRVLASAHISLAEAKVLWQKWPGKGLSNHQEYAKKRGPASLPLRLLRCQVSFGSWKQLFCPLPNPRLTATLYGERTKGRLLPEEISIWKSCRSQTTHTAIVTPACLVTCVSEKP
uniref:cDNA FLJ55309 n=1 Tax=Homo sapiens TaxID=9606 RepID=B7Z391_HUMAN|nr:unnamed protein product [Homo sapiens]